MSNKLDIGASIDFIEKHLCDDIKLDDIAKRSYFSEFHFHRLFRREAGTSLMNYIRTRRLSRAAAELTETEEDITGIALRYQFSSEESFSRAFKREYGICPRDYRNAARTIMTTERRNAGRIIVTSSHRDAGRIIVSSDYRNTTRTIAPSSGYEAKCMAA